MARSERVDFATPIRVGELLERKAGLDEGNAVREFLMGAAEAVAAASQAMNGSSAGAWDASRCLVSSSQS